jgi:hypothetical protein
MSDETKEKVEEALVNFIVRVSEGKTHCTTEIAILPEVVKALTDFNTNC